MAEVYVQGSSKPQLKTDWLSIGQFALSLLAILFLWLASLVLVLMAVGELLAGTGSEGNLVPLLLLASATTAGGLLLLPSAYYSGMHLMGRRVKPRPPLPVFLRPTLWIFLLPLVLLAGHWAGSRPWIAWLVLPPLHILAIGLPILWLVYLAVRRLPLGSPQRFWGVFGAGLVFGPVVILVLEFLAFILVFFLAVIWVSSQPELVDQLTRLVEQMRFGTIDYEHILLLLRPYLSRPEVILGTVAFGAAIVPLIEELLKPVGLWLIPGMNLTPAAGFTAGAISGAGYALFETLSMAPTAQEWSYLVSARLGTAVIHIFATALTGWGLASAWTGHRYARMVQAYLLAVTIHGLWNALTFIGVFAEVLDGAQPWEQVVIRIGGISPYALAVLALGCLFGLFWGNRILYRTQVQSPPPEAGGML